MKNILLLIFLFCGFARGISFVAVPDPHTIYFVTNDDDNLSVNDMFCFEGDAITGFSEGTRFEHNRSRHLNESNYINGFLVWANLMYSLDNDKFFRLWGIYSGELPSTETVENQLQVGPETGDHHDYVPSWGSCGGAQALPLGLPVTSQGTPAPMVIYQQFPSASVGLAPRRMFECCFSGCKRSFSTSDLRREHHKSPCHEEGYKELRKSVEELGHCPGCGSVYPFKNFNGFMAHFMRSEIHQGKKFPEPK